MLFRSASLGVEDKNATLNSFMANLKGETKMHFEGLLKHYFETHALLEKKEEDEREYADEIAALNFALEKEHELRVSLEGKLNSSELAQDEIIPKLTKERDHARTKYKLAKKKKVEFGVGHDKLTEELEKLTAAHKYLEGEHYTLTKSHEQLQIQLTQFNFPSTSTPSCDDANVIEENARLKKELANLKGKGPFFILCQCKDLLLIL